ncbi:alpha/beta-type small acid-soluble spore protein [Sporosarcina luteola]|uniref:alpha/beta-type small acid-soluble spore protein n=1 Tax=Sporosarcina luteola TaxID=582850 RepID=UPI00203ECD58|nr:alpha/beta-type small acid-soluble spore protein [Sporosarcina luteola]MCM3710967.1 alpha/beta-type small acid-soluble spore protein [Sporosarcina luteola]
MGRKNRILVPEARKQLDQLKVDVMRSKGYSVDAEHPDSVKYEIAKELGIPFSDGNNGKLTSEQAGKIGGPIGGNMVKEMIRLAQEQMANKNR